MQPKIPPGADDRILPAANSRQATPAKSARLVLIGIAVAAVLESAPLLHWTDNLPDNQVFLIAQQIARHWDNAVATLGAGGPREALRSVTRSLQALRF